MSSVSEFAEELTDIVSSLSVECTHNIILCGDLNCLGTSPHQVDDELQAAFDSLGLTLLVDAPTRSTALLDVLASTSPAVVCRIKVDDAGQLSDHCLVTANIATRCPKPTVPYSWRNLRRVNPDLFEEALRRSELFTCPADTTDEFVDQLVRVTTRELDKLAPLRYGHRRPPKPITKWLSVEAIAAKRERRRLERKWRRTMSEEDRLKYRRACRAANELINSSRRDYFRNRLTESEAEQSGKRWRIINELLHSNITDKTRTDEENSHLCQNFANFLYLKLIA